MNILCGPNSVGKTTIIESVASMFIYGHPTVKRNVASDIGSLYVKIEVDDNDYLTITAEKNSETNDEDSDKNYVRKERSYGKYQRSFYVGDIDKDNIDAKFENGILKITMPKKEEEKSSKKTIEVK